MPPDDRPAKLIDTPHPPIHRLAPLPKRMAALANRYLKGAVPDRRRVSGAVRRTEPGQVRPAVGPAAPMVILDSVGSSVSVERCLAAVRTASAMPISGDGAMCLSVVLAHPCSVCD